MSTRATYLFKADVENFKPRVTFYIHSDGYPSGAAQYFKAATEQRPMLDAISADDFYRANQAAELTRSHDAHFDTQYRYTVEGSRLIVTNKGRSRRWLTIWDGSIASFIAANA